MKPKSMSFVMIAEILGNFLFQVEGKGCLCVIIVDVAS
jgi:hypothetical protein